MGFKTRIPRVMLSAALCAAGFLLTTAAFTMKPTPLIQEKKGKKPLPLEGERTLAFSTSEGSWLSLDVSPDGRELVFELLGDLYVLPIQGGTATRILGGMAFDSQPRYSPDGKKIVFISDRSGGENVWVLTRDLKDTVQVSKGNNEQYQSPEWTPDGAYIVVTSSKGPGQSKLWLFHEQGGAGTQLIKTPSSLRTTGAAFGADPRYIWFARRTNGWQYNAMLPQYQLAVYDRDTGKSFTRTSVYGSAFRPTLSPDGKWLVYGTRRDEETGLRRRDLITGDESWLAYPVQRDDQESIATRDVLPGMSFTPDSRELVASWAGKIWRLPIDGGDATEIPFTAQVEMEIGPHLDFSYPIDDSAKLTLRQIRDAAPSPDGQRVAFSALDRLWVMDFPDGTPARLTNADIGEHHPAWSPDGKWIAYATWTNAGGHLYKMRGDGRGAPQRLSSTTGYYRLPAWSPDGTRVAALQSQAQSFLEEEGGPRGAVPASDLVWVSANGGSVTVIGPTEGRARPHFTSDPGRIFLYGTRDGLVSIRWDGSDLKSHVAVTGGKLPGASNPIRASLVMMAPKGDKALAQVVNDLYVVTVPVTGGDTPEISVSDPKNAAFPARKLTTTGGQFPGWSADGNAVHWSIGNAHFVYDLAAAKAAEDSARAAKKTAASDTTAAPDSTGGDPKDGPVYSPFEKRVIVRAARDIPKGDLILRGARLITMRGDEIVSNGDVHIKDNRIAALGAAGTIAAPAEARVIDVSGATIVPGFIDIHAHLRAAYGIHKREVWQYVVNLAYGVTTTRDPQTATTDVLTYADRVDTGDLLGPRIYYTGPGVFRTERIRDLDHARNILKRYSEYYHSHTIKQYIAGNRQQRQWLIMAAKEQNLMPTTEGALDLKLNLTQIIDGYPGHEHSFPIYPLFKDVIRLVADSKSVYTPTLLVAYGGPWAENYYFANENPHENTKLRHFTPHEPLDRRVLRRPGWFHRDQHVFDDHARFVTDLVAAGGLAGLGGHGQLQGLGVHWELWAMQSGGLAEHDALRVATLHSARAIGLANDLGSIEPGKLADLVVLDANPLESIRNSDRIRYVMKNGRLYDGNTMDEIWPRARKQEPFWWENREPAGLPGVSRRADSR